MKRVRVIAATVVAAGVTAIATTTHYIGASCAATNAAACPTPTFPVGGGGGALPTTHVCSGRSFYIDFVGGSDTNNGTATATPWKTAPGMKGGGSHNSYAHAVHDCFYFKGGVTWTAGNFPFEPLAGGDVADNDYYGPKYDWYASGSWSRPVLDAGSAVITGTCGGISGNADSILCLASANYTTWDDFEIQNWIAGSCSTNDNCTIIYAYDQLNLLWDHLYIHNLTATAAANFTNAKVIAQATFGNQSQSILQNSIIQCTAGNNVIDATRAVNYIYNSYISGCVGMFFPSGASEISGTSLIDCGATGFPAGVTNVHADAIQLNPVTTPPASYTLYVHNNIINGTGSAGSNECELGLIGNTGETDYVWNNLSWNIQGNSWALNQSGVNPGVASYFWNNTMVGGLNGTASCVRQVGGTWSTIKIQNNHCITDTGTPWATISATTYTNTNNVVRTQAQANADGTTSSQTPYVFFPPTGAAPTVNVGVSLSGSCSGRLADLCSDTTYGATIGTGNRITTPTRTAVARPQGGTWDAGAYER